MQNDQLIKKHKIMLTAQFPVDLVKFTEEIFNGKLHFLYSGCQDSEMTAKKQLLVAFLEKNCSLHSKTHPSLNCDAKASLHLTCYDLTSYNKKCWFYWFLLVHSSFSFWVSKHLIGFQIWQELLVHFAFSVELSLVGVQNTNFCRVPLKE